MVGARHSVLTKYIILLLILIIMSIEDIKRMEVNYISQIILLICSIYYLYRSDNIYIALLYIFLSSIFILPYKKLGGVDKKVLILLPIFLLENTIFFYLILIIIYSINYCIFKYKGIKKLKYPFIPVIFVSYIIFLFFVIK